MSNNLYVNDYRNNNKECNIKCMHKVCIKNLIPATEKGNR